jgi:phosphomannomutase
MQKNLLLFDVDGTICESGKKISSQIATQLNRLEQNGYELGIVGGGTFNKILYQLDNKVFPKYIFSECGSVYHKLNSLANNTNDFHYNLINMNNLRLEPEYLQINKLVKSCLKFISESEYLISGNFIDLRNGLIYVSMVGMVATDEEREDFIQLDKLNNYRTKLIQILKEQATQLGIRDNLDICLGGSVGIAIYPKKWNKVQVLDWLNISEYFEIHYFGDKYLPNGNDYELINHERIIGHRVNNLEETLSILIKL